MQKPHLPATVAGTPSGENWLSWTHLNTVAGRQAKCPDPASSPDAATNHGSTHRSCTTTNPSARKLSTNEAARLLASLHQAVPPPPVASITRPRTGAVACTVARKARAVRLTAGQLTSMP